MDATVRAIDPAHSGRITLASFVVYMRPRWRTTEEALGGHHQDTALLVNQRAACVPAHAGAMKACGSQCIPAATTPRSGKGTRADDPLFQETVG